jgi:hypothetical protein
MSEVAITFVSFWAIANSPYSLHTRPEWWVMTGIRVIS